MSKFPTAGTKAQVLEFIAAGKGTLTSTRIGGTLASMSKDAVSHSLS